MVELLGEVQIVFFYRVYHYFELMIVCARSTIRRLSQCFSGGRLSQLRALGRGLLLQLLIQKVQHDVGVAAADELTGAVTRAARLVKTCQHGSGHAGM